jgi:hypothetical protein
MVKAVEKEYEGMWNVRSLYRPGSFMTVVRIWQGTN